MHDVVNILPGGTPVTRWLAAVLVLMLAAWPAGRVDAGTTATVPVQLYFRDMDGRFLKADAVSMDGDLTPLEMGRAIIAALLAGPERPQRRTVPEGTTLNAFFITADKTAYVDLGPSISTALPGGIRQEQIALYSIVNSLVLNLAAVDRVKILINGQDADTLAGHIDLRRSYGPNMLMIK